MQFCALPLCSNVFDLHEKQDEIQLIKSYNIPEQVEKFSRDLGKSSWLLNGSCFEYITTMKKDHGKCDLIFNKKNNYFMCRLGAGRLLQEPVLPRDHRWGARTAQNQRRWVTYNSESSPQSCVWMSDRVVHTFIFIQTTIILSWPRIVVLKARSKIEICSWAAFSSMFYPLPASYVSDITAGVNSPLKQQNMTRLDRFSSRVLSFCKTIIVTAPKSILLLYLYTPFMYAYIIQHSQSSCCCLLI